MSRRAAIFCGLALALSALCLAAVPVIGEAVLILTMLTPALATVAMLALFAPEPGGVRGALAGLGLTRAGLSGMPLAVLAPAAIILGGVAVMVALGLTEPASLDAPVPWVRLAVSTSAGLVVTTGLALLEEIGWRGYLLPRFGDVRPVAAMLAVGFVHGLWHLPLILGTGYYHGSANPWIQVPMFLLALTLAGVFYGWLRLRTGSVWPVAVAHGAVNTALHVAEAVTVAGSPLVLDYIGGENGVLTICGLLLLDLWLIRALRRQPRPLSASGA